MYRAAENASYPKSLFSRMRTGFHLASDFDYQHKHRIPHVSTQRSFLLCLKLQKEHLATTNEVSIPFLLPQMKLAFLFEKHLITKKTAKSENSWTRKAYKQFNRKQKNIVWVWNIHSNIPNSFQLTDKCSYLLFTFSFTRYFIHSFIHSFIQLSSILVFYLFYWWVIHFFTE